MNHPPRRRDAEASAASDPEAARQLSALPDEAVVAAPRSRTYHPKPPTPMTTRCWTWSRLKWPHPTLRISTIPAGRCRYRRSPRHRAAACRAETIAQAPEPMAATAMASVVRPFLEPSLSRPSFERPVEPSLKSSADPTHSPTFPRLDPGRERDRAQIRVARLRSAGADPAPEPGREDRAVFLISRPVSQTDPHPHCRPTGRSRRSCRAHRCGRREARQGPPPRPARPPASARERQSRPLCRLRHRKR